MYRDPRILTHIWRDTLSASKICPTVTEWADTYRFLPRNASAEPGPWRTSRTPYLRKIQDVSSIGDPSWKIVIKGANQLGKSEAVNNLVCYRIDQFPCPILWVVPRDKDVIKYVRSRLDPIFSATPRISSIIGTDESGGDAADNAVLKRFPGGQIMVAGSSSPAVFRSDPIEVVVLDDLDACADNVEGDIVELATKRTNTFSDRARKVVCISTPTIDGASSIEREFLASSQNRYHVPCPHCGAFQVLVWERIVWLPEAPAAPWYACVHCGEKIEEDARPRMLELGHWQPERPELCGKVEGFEISALYSPWRKWGDIVLAFLAAKRELDTEGSHRKLQTFYNLELAKTFVLPSQVRLQGIEMEVYNRREPPFDARVLPIPLTTMGVDVQGNRLEASIYGWGAGRESWLLDHVVLKGAVEEHGVWDELVALATGHRAMSICVDAGDNSQLVRDQVARILRPLLEQRCAIWPIKGQSGRRNIWPKAIRPGELVNIGIDDAKDAIYGSFDRCTEPGPGYIHLPTSCNQAWFHQLFSERPTTAQDRTRARYVKVAGRRRNEALDCAVYARAAMYAVCALDETLTRALLHLDDHPGAPGPSPSMPPPAQSAPTPAPSQAATGQAPKSWVTSGIRRGGGSWINSRRRRR